jgi:hypothetical protein
LFEKFKERLGLISSKEMWPIISFSILRGGQLWNCVLRFWGKILSANRCSRYSAFEIATSEFWKTKFIQFSIRLQILILKRVLMRSNITNPKWSIIYITEVVYTAPNRSSVHSIRDRPNPIRHGNCIQ